MKQILEFPNYYVDSDGNVYSIRNGKVKKLKPLLFKSGYTFVQLYKNKKAKMSKISRIVAKAFIENPLNKLQVNHIDGNKQNNKVSNLEWCTSFENMQHAYDTGLLKGRKGERHHRCKFNDTDIIEIRNLIENGYTLTAISKIYNVSRDAIGKIKRGERWSHV